MSPFDPLKFASDIANGIGSGIGQVASDAFRIAEQAGAAGGRRHRPSLRSGDKNHRRRSQLQTRTTL